MKDETLCNYIFLNTDFVKLYTKAANFVRKFYQIKNYLDNEGRTT